MSTARAAQLMRNFRLSPQSTQEELQAAYHKLAKLYHPDVAKGQDTEEQFKKITHDYQEAMDLHKQGLWPKTQGVAPGFGGSSGSSYGGAGGPRASQQWHQGHWQNEGMGGDAETWKQYANIAREEREARRNNTPPQTAAQRLRNLVLAAGGGLALLGLFLYNKEPADDLYARKRREPPVLEDGAEFARKSSRSVRSVGAGSFSYPVAPPTSHVVEILGEEIHAPSQQFAAPVTASAEVGPGTSVGGKVAAIVPEPTIGSTTWLNHQVAEQEEQRRAGDVTTSDQAPVETEGAPVKKKKSRNRTDEDAGSYYARRTVKGSTVKVRSTDVYVSPQDDAKVRPDEEGLGKSFSDLVSIAQGYRPSEAKKEPGPVEQPPVQSW